MIILNRRITFSRLWSNDASRALIASLFTVMLSLSLGADVPRGGVFARIALFSVLALLLGAIAGPFVYLWLLLLVSSVYLPYYNLTKLPLIGLLLADIRLEQGFVLYAGGLYLLYYLGNSIRGGRLAGWKGFLPLGITVVSGFCVASFFAWFAGENELGWYRQTILVGAVLFLLTYAFSTNAARFEAILWALALSGVVFSILVFVAPTSAYEAYTETGRLDGYWRLPLGFAMGGDKVYLSSYLAICTVLAWSILSRVRLTLLRIGWWFAILMMAVVQLQTISRTGLYGSIIGIVLLTVFRIACMLTRSDSSDGLKRRLFGLGKAEILLAVVGFAAVAALLANSLVDLAAAVDSRLRLVDLDIYRDQSSLIRLDLIQVSLAINLANPLGVGTLALPSLTRINDHSFYTLLLSGLGWIGLASLFSVIALCFIECIRAMGSKDYAVWDTGATLLSVLISILLMGWGHPIVGLQWGVHLFWVLLGLAAALGKLTSTSKTNLSSTGVHYVLPP